MNRVLFDVVHLDHLNAGILREHVAHAVQTALQVRRADARDDRDLPLAAQQLHRLLRHDASRRVVVDAVERDALRGRRVRVPGDHRNARVDRPVDRVREERTVEARDRDAVHALRDERLQDLLLLQLIGVRRPVPEDLHVAELLGLALRPGLRVVEHGQVERFRNDREPERLLPAAGGLTAAAARRGARQTRGRDADQ